jgi:RNA polymerase subunit RPABC4/transcription elongation factor Spt4
MEKYGVEEEKNKGKTAADADACPKCGSKVEKHGDVKICPEDGSEPFEKKDEDA